jgi:O-antigen/teichoic acid export membrane protein
MSTKKSILKNFMANGFGLGVQLLNQIALVPVFLTYWGVDKYGDWIMLTAVSGFFAMTDLGLNSVSVNEFSIWYAKGEREYCKKILANNFIIILFIAFISILLSLLYVYFRDVSSDFGLSVTDRFTASFVFVILISFIFIGMLGGIVNGIYRALSKTHIAGLIDNTSRLLEAFILLGGIMLKLDIKLIVVLYLFPRIIFTIIKHIQIYKYFPVNINFRLFDFPMVKKMIIPSISFMSFPIGNAIILQGFSIVVNKYLGATSLVVFNTTRTIVNFIRSNMGVINNSVWPEITNAFGRKDFNTIRKIHRYSITMSVLIAIGVFIFLILFGKPIYLLWTKHVVEYDNALMLLFLISMIISSIWYTSSVILAATNNHINYSKLYLATTVLAILLCIGIVRITHNVSYVPLSLLVIDIVMAIYIFRKSLVISNDTWMNFVINLKTDIHVSINKIKNKLSL